MRHVFHYSITIVAITFLVGGVLFVPEAEHVAHAGDSTYSVLSPLPGTGNEVDTDEPGTYLQTMYQIAVGLAALLAVLMLVIGGFQYMTSEAFNTKEQAKNRIWGAIGGLLLILASWLILNVINPELLEFDFGDLRSGIEESVQGGSVGAETDTQGDTVPVAGSVPNYPACGSTSEFPCTIVSDIETIPSTEQSQCESEKGPNAQAIITKSGGLIECITTVDSDASGIDWCLSQPAEVCTTSYGNLRDNQEGYIFTDFSGTTEANQACNEAGGSYEIVSGATRHCIE
jgi:hypothetical protein